MVIEMKGVVYRIWGFRQEVLQDKYTFVHCAT